METLFLGGFIGALCSSRQNRLSTVKYYSSNLFNIYCEVILELVR